MQAEKWQKRASESSSRCQWIVSLDCPIPRIQIFRSIRSQSKALRVCFKRVGSLLTKDQSSIAELP